MKTMHDLYAQVRERFPELASKADDEFTRLGFEVEPSFLWFDSLAQALNIEMGKGVPAQDYESLFSFFASALASGESEVRECIDVSFVENLFWKVPSEPQIRAYWQRMPSSLQLLYIAFHGAEP